LLEVELCEAALAAGEDFGDDPRQRAAVVGEPPEEEPVDEGPEALVRARPGTAAIQKAGRAGIRVEPHS